MDIKDNPCNGSHNIMYKIHINTIKGNEARTDPEKERDMTRNFWNMGH